MRKIFGREWMTRKERRQLKTQLAAIPLETLLDKLTPGMMILPRSNPSEAAFLQHFPLREIKWLPKTGEVVYVAQDGTECIRHANTQLSLHTAEGNVILHGMPYPPGSAPCMDGPASGQA